MSSRKVRRPTEEMALSRIAREAIKRGITQSELLGNNSLMSSSKVSKDGKYCHCVYCRRKKSKIHDTNKDHNLIAYA